MGWQLRNCCRWMVVVAFLLGLCVPSISFADNSLQSSNKERSSLYANTNSLELSSEGSSLSSTADSLQPGDERSSLWELPIITGQACDPSTSECRGSVITEISYQADDGDSVSDVAEVSKTIETKGRQGAVLCNVKCFRADPVCGEDAVTYWCGAAEAKCAGVEVAYTGYCDLRSGGVGKDGTRAAQSLFLVHLMWLVLAGILVVADVL